MFPALQADILPSEPPGKFLRHQGMRGCNCAQVSRPPPPPPAPHPQLPSQHSASAIPATGMGLLPASPLCPPIPLRTKVRLSGGLSDKTGEGGGGEKASRVSQGACPLAPPPLPSPCNFLSLRWREGNVKDDGLKGGSWGQKRRDHRVEEKENTQEAGGRVQGREAGPAAAEARSRRPASVNGSTAHSSTHHYPQCGTLGFRPGWTQTKNHLRRGWGAAL